MVPPTGPSVDPLADLRDRFIRRTRQRLQALRDAIEDGPLDQPTLELIGRTAHQAAGTAGTFGYVGLGRAAAALELAARGLDTTSAADKARLRDHLRILEASLDALA